MALQPVCAVDELPVGEKKAFNLADRFIVLYHLEDGFYATRRLCTHMFAPLDRGVIVGGDQIQCPLHGSRFDIRTGEVKRWANFPPGIQLLNIIRSEQPLPTYPTVINDGMVYVDIE
jgi:3-phenylpropionate/trans-cinnamate dioxygenase ferredoxin subunit